MLKGIGREATYYYHPDHLGSVSVVSNHRGEPYERVEYLPFGEIWIEETDPATGYIPFRFTAKELDEETGLYYYGARYYEPATSRWMSPDPAGFELINPMDEDGEPLADGWPEGFGPEQSGGMRQGYSVIEALNWYAYVSNNPVKYVDPTGKVDVYYGYSWTSANRVGGQYVTQNTARDADMYQQGGGGPYSLNVGPYTTWCNQATFDIAEKTGFDTTDMYGGKDRGFVTANDAARNLSLTQASTYSELLEVSGGQAQALADKGYTVIAAWENKNGGSGHIATVRAYEEYTDEDGPTVSNVGQWNSILSVRDAFAVKEGGASSMDDIKYYYDPNQKFED